MVNRIPPSDCINYTYLLQTQPCFCPGKDGVPEAGLQVVLHFGAVEEGAHAPHLQLGAAVINEDPKHEERARTM